MTECIKRDDPRYFTCTCDKPYDRHHYQIVFKDKNPITFETWEEVKSYWWNNSWFDKPVINVIDKPKSISKGFK